MSFASPPQPAAVESSAAVHEAVVGTAPAPVKKGGYIRVLNSNQRPGLTILGNGVSWVRKVYGHIF